MALAIVGVTIAVGAWFLFKNNNSSSAINTGPEQNNIVTPSGNTQNAPKNTATPATFVVSDVRVANNLKVDDGNPQTNDGEFIVTWNVSNDTTAIGANVFLNFAVVDDTDTEVVGHLYGAGVGSTFRDEKWTLQMPPLCSSVPIDGCFSKVDTNKKYRLRAVGSVCADKDINPVYCSESDTTLTAPVYSNWFSLSS